MAPDPLFESAWLKWAQAAHHMKTLKTEFDADPVVQGKTDPLVATRTEYQPRRHGFVIYAKEVLPVPKHWSLILGDIAHNLRSTLDHLAWALVSRGKTPPDKLKTKQVRNVAFPINRKRLEFKGALPQKLPGVRRSDIALVRTVQPYHRSARNQWRQGLVLLQNLNNDDKHKAINPVWLQPTTVNLEVTDIRDCEIPSRRKWPRGPAALEVGAKLAFIPARKTGREPYLEVATLCTVVPALSDRISVVEWLETSSALIAKLLREFSEPPEVAVAIARAWFGQLWWSVPTSFPGAHVQAE
jgi:hypothetical protein